jgi:hypothetical protein
LYSEGVKAISRWLSAATPPVNAQRYVDPEGITANATPNTSRESVKGTFYFNCPECDANRSGCHGHLRGFLYYVLNRGNARNDVFHKPEDFLAFVKQ